MQPESKPLSIPDFKPLPMKPIQLLTLVFFSIVCSYTYAQNLQFNSAVFYEYGGGISDGDEIAEIVTLGTLIVASNKVLKITNIAGYITNFTLTAAFINEKALGGGDIYLPSGTYSIGFGDSYYPGEIKGYISGVLYDIVP